MLPAHIAARELERRRAEQSAEFARQLPHYAEDFSHHPGEERSEVEVRRAPDWTFNY